VRNANDGISLAQTAEGALQETTNGLQRIRELSVQAANDTNTAEDRASIQLEIDQLVNEIDRIAEATTFNNKNILDGSSGTFKFQIGANANETIGVDLVNVKANALGQQPGIVQSTTSRVSLSNDAADGGSIGIQEGATGNTITAGDISVQIAGASSVDIAQDKYGGDITSASTADLKDTNSANYGSGSAKAIAERINTVRDMNEEDQGEGMEGKTLEGVYAKATTTFKASDLDAADYSGSTAAGDEGPTNVGVGRIGNSDLMINGVGVGPAEFKENDADGSLTNAINAKSHLTGVTASVDEGGELTLSADDGRDIVMSTTNSEVTNLVFGGGVKSTSFDSNFSDLRVTGSVSLTASDTISLGGTNATDAGFATLTEDNVQAKGSMANADVSTTEAANETIKSVDSAIKQVDDMRANLGAVQNRFESTIQNLSNVSENLSASRSRILDTDFASETANMTKLQVMQQAGTAMLAQANQLPQSVLSLIG
jgi:flagellin